MEIKDTRLDRPALAEQESDSTLSASPNRLPPTEEASSGATTEPATDPKGLLIVNADDWGRDQGNTDRILECFLDGAISSASSMVFMEDSERAAAIAREKEVDVGIHLNFTTPFSAPGSPSQLQEHQQRICQHLQRHRYSQVLFHPGLTNSFHYVIAAQIDEFRRLYGTSPTRLDGHHHMHLCANVLLEGLLPAGTTVRRSFSFRPGEKSHGNRLYRSIVDRILARRHRLVDYFFALPPLAPPERLQRLFSLADQSVVEVETHPVHPDEYRFFRSGEIFRVAGDIPIARRHVSGSGSERSLGSSISKLRGRLTCSLPYAFAFGATVYQSLAEFTDYL